MISVVLFDKEAVCRIIKRAKKYFLEDSILGISECTLWLNGCYMEFKPDSIIINPYNLKLFSRQDVLICLSNLLLGEEAYISDSNQHSQYFTKVTPSEKFDGFLQS